MSRNFVNLTGTSSDNNGAGRKRPRKPVRPPPLSPANSNADEDMNDEHFYDQIHQKKVHKRNGVLIRGQWVHREGMAEFIRSRQAQRLPPTNLLRRPLTAAEVALVIGQAAAQVQAVVAPPPAAAAQGPRRFVYVRRSSPSSAAPLMVAGFRTYANGRVEQAAPVAQQQMSHRYYRLQLQVRADGTHWIDIRRRDGNAWRDPHQVPGARASTGGRGVFQILLIQRNCSVSVALGDMFSNYYPDGFSPITLAWTDLPGQWRAGGTQRISFFTQLKDAVAAVQAGVPAQARTLLDRWAFAGQMG